MGEGRKEALRVDFDRSVKVEFHGAKVTSDAGLLAFRELGEALGLTRQGDRSSCGRTHRSEHTTHPVGAAQAISVQPPGGLRGHKLC